LPQGFKSSEYLIKQSIKKFGIVAVVNVHPNSTTDVHLNESI
jgi:hypothetical protein